MDDIDRARSEPHGQLLSQLSQLRWFFSSRLTDQDYVSAAEQLQVGKVELPGYVSARVGIPFDPRDIDQGESSWQLFLARLGIPLILVKAYEATTRTRYLLLARDVINGWADYEATAWRSKGFLWNDHAIAARIQVIAHFWQHYRRNAEYEDSTAVKILRFASRGANLLAKRYLYICTSNHGLLQNLGLLHFSLAFPTLPNALQFRELAVSRIAEQMRFYLNNEGVILEHSTLYQKFGIELLFRAFRYLEYSGSKIPPDWQSRYELAIRFYLDMRRPDGSIPVFGDSWSNGESPNPWLTGIDADEHSLALCEMIQCRPRSDFTLFPVAGYSVWWNNLQSWPRSEGLEQIMIAWSHFSGHAHKHADEMSISFWAGGQTWWTNIGNWPRDKQGRAEAISWRGSNAPHLVGERADDRRSTTLRYFGQSSRLRAIDLRRSGKEGFVICRQVFHLKPNLWIVMDSTKGHHTGLVETLWTTASNVDVESLGNDRSYRLSAPGCRKSLSVLFLASPGTTIDRYYGSDSPFAGWETDRFALLPAQAIEIQQPANSSWTVLICSVEEESTSEQQRDKLSATTRWNDAERWALKIETVGGAVEICRDLSNVSFYQVGRKLDTLALDEGPDVTTEINRLERDFNATKKRYPNPRSRRIIRRLGMRPDVLRL